VLAAVVLQTHRDQEMASAGRCGLARPTAMRRWQGGEEKKEKGRKEVAISQNQTTLTWQVGKNKN